MNNADQLAEALRALLAKNTRFSGGTWDRAREALRLYEQAKAQHSRSEKLPPLPEPRWRWETDPADAYTADQMHAYARAALAQRDGA